MREALRSIRAESPEAQHGTPLAALNLDGGQPDTKLPKQRLQVGRQRTPEAMVPMNKLVEVVANSEPKCAVFQGERPSQAS